MSDEPLAREREPIERVRARLEALVMANAAPRCGARSKRTGKPCRAAAMPNGRCKLHGGKSTGPRTMEGLASSFQLQGQSIIIRTNNQSIFNTGNWASKMARCLGFSARPFRGGFFVHLVAHSAPAAKRHIHS